MRVRPKSREAASPVVEGVVFRDDYYYSLKGMEDRAQTRELQAIARSQESILRTLDRREKNLRPDDIQLAGAELREIRDLLTRREGEVSREARETSRTLGDLSATVANVSDVLTTGFSRVNNKLVELRDALGAANMRMAEIAELLRNSLSNESRQYFEQGAKCYGAAEMALARERFEKGLECDRTNFSIHMAVAQLAIDRGDSSCARRHFELASKFGQSDASRARAMYHLARVILAEGDKQQANEWLRRAADTDPTKAWLWYELAVHLAAVGDWVAATAALRRAVPLGWELWAIAANEEAFRVDGRLHWDVREVLEELKRQEGAAATQAHTLLKAAVLACDEWGLLGFLRPSTTASRYRTARLQQAYDGAHSAIAFAERRMQDNSVYGSLEVRALCEQSLEQLQSRMSELVGDALQLFAHGLPSSASIGCEPIAGRIETFESFQQHQADAEREEVTSYGKRVDQLQSSSANNYDWIHFIVWPLGIAAAWKAGSLGAGVFTVVLSWALLAVAGMLYQDGRKRALEEAINGRRRAAAKREEIVEQMQDSVRGEAIAYLERISAWLRNRNFAARTPA